MFDLQKILNEEGINLPSTSDGGYKVKCRECQPPHNERDRPLSVTIDHEGIRWLCHHCDRRGGRRKDFGSFLRTKPKPTYNKPQISEKSPTDKMYEFFKSRGISRSTVDGLKIKSDKNMIAFNYFDSDGSVANVKFRGNKKTFVQTPGTKQILYNYDNIYKSEEVIFVEGEMDVCALYECGFTNVTSLPGGAPKEFKGDDKDKRFFPLENSPLPDTKKIILFTDNDEPGKALHKELLHRFGRDLCWFVKVPEGIKDANDVLQKHGKQTLIDLIKDAEPYPVEGLFTVNDYTNDVLDLYDGNYEKPLSCGIDCIDNIYQIMPGTFQVVTGVPNHGKSLLLDQILLNMARDHGWKFCLFSPEHSVSMHIRRLVQMHLHQSFDPGFTNRMSKEELIEGMNFINKHFYFIETKDHVPDIDLLLKIGKQAIYKFGCKAMILDPFNEISSVRAQNQREDEWIRDFISKCKRFARLHNIVFYVVAHPTKMPRETNGKYQIPDSYSISGSAHWSNLSDVIITVYRDFEDNTTQLITRKIREQDLYGKIGSAYLKYDITKRSFVESIVQPTDNADADVPSGTNYIELYD